jgi:hypothetical protein
MGNASHADGPTALPKVDIPPDSGIFSVILRPGGFHRCFDRVGLDPSGAAFCVELSSFSPDRKLQLILPLPTERGISVFFFCCLGTTK